MAVSGPLDYLEVSYWHNLK